MRTLALCAASFQKSVKQAAGVEPLLSPPVNIKTFDPHSLEGYDFIYFKLHGLPNQPFWYGDNWLTTLSANQLSQADLSETTIFVANCHLYTILNAKLVPSTMLLALLHSNAAAVVGGPDINFARSSTVRGADKLGQYFRYACQLGAKPKTAFKVAKKRIELARKRTFATEDTLDFCFFDQTFFNKEVRRC